MKFLLTSDHTKELINDIVERSVDNDQFPDDEIENFIYEFKRIVSKIFC